MKWIDEIIVEAGRVFWQATRITFQLLWYAGLAIVAIVHRSGFQLRDFRLRGKSRWNESGQIAAKVCPVCNAENEAAASRCFVCGNKL